MPHYKDGSPAKVGDMVRGKPYNTPHEVTGVVTLVTPGQESCNLKVAFAGTAQLSDGTVLVRLVDDYGETAAFEKVT